MVRERQGRHNGPAEALLEGYMEKNIGLYISRVLVVVAVGVCMFFSSSCFFSFLCSSCCVSRFRPERRQPIAIPMSTRTSPGHIWMILYAVRHHISRVCVAVLLCRQCIRGCHTHAYSRCLMCVCVRHSIRGAQSTHQTALTQHSFHIALQWNEKHQTACKYCANFARQNGTGIIPHIAVLSAGVNMCNNCICRRQRNWYKCLATSFTHTPNMHCCCCWCRLVAAGADSRCADSARQRKRAPLSTCSIDYPEMRHTKRLSIRHQCSLGYLLGLISVFTAIR